MGVIYKYTCNDCGYAAEVDEGVGFVISSELRQCLTTSDVVGVTVSVRSKSGRQPPEDIQIRHCPDCGSADVVEPARAGKRRRIACPRCGAETRRTEAGRWD